MRLINPRSPIGRLTRTDWLSMAALGVVFVLVALVSTPENALAVMLTLGVLAIVVQAKWSSRRDPRLWAVIGTVGAVQFPAAFLVHIPRLSAGAVSVPFVLVEGFALWGLLNWMERRFPRA